MIQSVQYPYTVMAFGYAIGSSPATTMHSSAEMTQDFHGGGFDQLSVQAVMVVIIIAWTAVTAGIAFTIIKRPLVFEYLVEEEIAGLDVSEHGNSDTTWSQQLSLLFVLKIGSPLKEQRLFGELPLMAGSSRFFMPKHQLNNLQFWE